jgi:catechol 2,3-dioxygenase-like lactoylglutathione lyase family enzyme
MAIVLNHLIVPAHDKAVAAEFLADLLGLQAGAQTGPFIPVQVNADLTFDFDDRGPATPGHYAFLIDDRTFDRVLAHLAANPAIEYGSGRVMGWDREINHLGGGRGVYVQDPNRHSYELFTAVPA